MASRIYDQHFTTEELAGWLVQQVKLDSVTAVADFAAGSGNLLKAAVSFWPAAQIYAVDRDPDILTEFRKSFSTSPIICGDFLSDACARKIRSRFGALDVVLLNPPFSIRSAGLVSICFCGEMFNVSPALAFVNQSLEFVRDGGVVAALIPHGVLWSVRDRMLLGKIGQLYTVEVVADNLTRRFEHADVRCAAIRIVKTSPSIRMESVVSKCSSLLVRRGAVDHVGIRGRRSRARHQVKVIHTSNLKGGDLNGVYAVLGESDCTASVMSGASIAIPRVGRFNPSKIALVEDTSGVQFTKCVITVALPDMSVGRQLLRKFKSCSEDWRCVYGGTGAQFTTIFRVQELLANWGF